MNLLSLFLLALAGLISIKKRVLPFAVSMFFIAFLTVGQGLYFDRILEQGRWITILFSYISWAGYESAKIFVLMISVLLFFISIVARPYKKITVHQKYIFVPTTNFYLALCLAEIVLFGFLVFVVVGLSEFLSSSRPGYQSGSTVFIVLLFLGVVPILIKLACGQPPALGDVLLLVIATAATSSFSRIHCIFYLTAVVYSAYYGLGKANKRMEFRGIFTGAIVSFVGLFIFFGIGAIRDALNFTSADFGSVLRYLADNPEKSLLSLDYNYTVGVEGMSGLAGAFTQMYDSPNSANFDFGLHWMLRGAMQWFPGFVKEYFAGVYEFLDSINWYNGSIVAPGVETAFTSFGWAGVVIFPLMLYFIVWYPVVRKVVDISYKVRVFAFVNLGLSIFLVRGSWTVWVGYSITYYLLLSFTWFIFRRYIRIIK